MNEQKFIVLVRKMREAQKEYFRTRQPGWLKISKEMEKKVDAVLRREESNLFNEGGEI